MKWEIAPQISTDIRTQILHNRGIVDKAEKDRFLNPRIDNYNEVFDLDNLDTAKNRIEEAIAKKQKIVIYGDYDVDGICSSAIMYRGLKSLGAEVKPFIPHRMDHGYGLSVKGIDELLKTNAGVGLIITVDNGIVAYEGLDYAKKLGIGVIVTDHHEKGDKEVAALTVHTTELCGSGIAWVLVRELVDAKLADELLQLAAVGTIADVMPMRGVNRAIVVEGIEVLKKTPNLGLKILAKHLNLSLSQLSAERLSFDLVPKMNAAGRLDSALPALRMLCFEDVWRVEEFAEILTLLNNERKLQTKAAIEEAKEQIVKDANVNVVSGNWHPGIVGLVAGRLAEMSNKPTLAIAVNNGNSRGSARSVEGINIVELLRSRKEMFTELGGHSGAAGFGLGEDAIAPIREWLSSVELDRNSEPKIFIDVLIDPKSISEKLIDEIESLAPFGGGNPKPVMGSQNTRITEYKRIGNGSHLKLLVCGVDAVGFGMGDKYNLIQKSLIDGNGIKMAYLVEMNEFNGNRAVQMKLIDLDVDD